MVSSLYKHPGPCGQLASFKDNTFQIGYLMQNAAQDLVTLSKQVAASIDFSPKETVGQTFKLLTYQQ